MDNKKYLVKSISNITLINIFSICVTAIMTIVVPRYIGLYDYGLWQLFVFYQGYLGVLNFGWNDGIYLRYGGKEYKTLNKQSFFSQFYLQLFFELFIAMIMILYCFSLDVNHMYIFFLLAINLIIINSRYMLIYILQTTARIKEYAVILFVERLVYIISIFIFIICDCNDFKSFILAETISKILSYIVSIIYCKDIVIRTFRDFIFDFKEIYLNVNVGIKILISNVASMLIIGIVRWGIEKNWSIEVFGEVSLTITLSQLFITFITNIGLVLFPLLKKINKDEMIKICRYLRTILFIMLSIVLLCYFGGKVLFIKWLPNYENSIKYMGILLPICFYESKMALVNNTFLKALRREKEILLVNCVVFMLSLLTTLMFTYVIKNLLLAILSITIILAIRCNWLEVVVNRRLNIKSMKNIFIENIVMCSFVICSYYIKGIIGMSLYLIFLIFGVLLNKKALNEVIKLVKNKVIDK